MLSATSTDWAPWYVIPADHKWFARICASAIIANALIEIDPRYPKVTAEARAALQQTKVELEGEAPKGAAPDPFEAEAGADAEKAGKNAKGKAKKTAKHKSGKKAGKKGGKAAENTAEASTT